MLIVNNPSNHKLDITDQHRVLTIHAKKDGQQLAVAGEQAEKLKARLSKAYPYLTFSEAKSEAQNSKEKSVITEEVTDTVENNPSEQMTTQTAKRGRQ